MVIKHIIGIYKYLTCRLVILLFLSPIVVNADDSTYLGHDYPRKIAANKAKTTFDEVSNQYNLLVKKIQEKNKAEPDEHFVQTLQWLKEEQDHWLKYSHSHCQFISYVYIYPAGSRMSFSQYNSCKADMNEKRLKFLRNISSEY